MTSSENPARPLVVGYTDRPESRRALEWAIARAARDAVPLEVIAVVGGVVGAAGETSVVASAQEEVAALAAAAVALAQAAGVDARAQVRRGDATRELVDASERASLVVIGGDPAREGRHARRIAAGAHTPVVVVPAGAPTPADAGPGTVYVGADGSDPAAAATTFAAAEAARRGAALVIVSAWLPVVVASEFFAYPDPYLSDLQEATQGIADQVAEGVRAEHPGLAVSTIVEQGDPATVIVEAARGAELVVVGSHGRGAFARFLLGSVSEDVIAQLPTVVAVVR